MSDLVSDTIVREWREQRARYPTIVLLSERHPDAPGMWSLRAWQERSPTHLVKLRYAVAVTSRELAESWMAQNLPEFRPWLPLPDAGDPNIRAAWK